MINTRAPDGANKATIIKVSTLLCNAWTIGHVDVVHIIALGMKTSDGTSLTTSPMAA